MKYTPFVFLLFFSISISAQTKWVDPLKTGPMMHGQGWNELRSVYVRLPDRAEADVRPAVWSLSRHSAGLSLVFRSNADNIKVRYQVESSSYSMFHMPSTGVSGVDMYAIDREGRHRWCAPDFTPSFRDTISYEYSKITYFPKGAESYEYHLYLPLYNSVKWLEVGVPEDADITFYPESGERPLVFYGTSIAQGACASRPGMGWTNIVARELGLPAVNLAFSGNGRLEPALFDLLSEIDAKMYIICCMPNMHPEDPVDTLAVNGVHRLRQSRDCPVLLVEDRGFVGEDVSEAKSDYRRANEKLRKAYETLLSEGVERVYYMTCEEIGLKMDDTVEGVHPNDLGMRHIADGYEKRIREILDPR